jgi:hypothetical protein
MTDDELQILAAFQGGNTELRVARTAVHAEGLTSLLQRGLLIEVGHCLGDQVAVFVLTPAGHTYLGLDGASYH